MDIKERKTIPQSQNVRTVQTMKLTKMRINIEQQMKNVYQAIRVRNVCIMKNRFVFFLVQTSKSDAICLLETRLSTSGCVLLFAALIENRCTNDSVLLFTLDCAITVSVDALLAVIRLVLVFIAVAVVDEFWDVVWLIVCVLLLLLILCEWAEPPFNTLRGNGFGLIIMSTIKKIIESK